MTISKRDKKLLLILLGALIFLAAYLLVYNRFTDEAKSARTELSELSPRLTELRSHKANLDNYQREIDEISGAVKEELAKFPSDVRTEDLILYGSGLESAVGMTVSAMTFTPAEVISRFNVPLEGEDGRVELIPYAALRTGLTVEGDINYAEFKRLVNYIYSTAQRTTLESVSLNYNAETGELSAAAQLAKYFVCGEEYVYEATRVPGFKAGVDDPFGLIAGGQAPADGPGDVVEIED